MLLGSSTFFKSKISKQQNAEMSEIRVSYQDLGEEITTGDEIFI